MVLESLLACISLKAMEVQGILVIARKGVLERSGLGLGQLDQDAEVPFYLVALAFLCEQLVSSQSQVNCQQRIDERQLTSA